MCRLYFSPGETDALRLGVEFAALEQAMGGDGNGLALLGPDTQLVKGVTKSPLDLAALAVESGGPFMFHTRAASLGGVTDALCQPFKLGAKRPIVVAHNGHWSDWTTGSNLLLDRGKMQFVPLNVSDSLIGDYRDWET